MASDTEPRDPSGTLPDERIEPAWAPWGRAFGLWALCVVGLVALQGATVEGVTPVVVGLALFTGLAGGRVARRSRVPAALGVVLTGVLIGPGLGRLLGRLLPAWPRPEGLWTAEQVATAVPLGTVATGLALLWVGQRLRVTEVTEQLRELVAMFLGHVVVAALLAVGAGWLLLGGEALGPAGLVRSADELGGLLVVLLGTSGVLTAAVLHERDEDGPVVRVLLWVAVLGEVASLVALGTWWAVADTGAPLLLSHPGGPAVLASTVVLGALVGAILSVGTRFAPEAAGVWVTLAGAVALAAAGAAGFHVALVALVAGLVLGNTLPRSIRRFGLLDRAAGLSFVVLLTLAGAQVPLAAVIRALPVALGLFVLRLVVLVPVLVGAVRLVGGLPSVARVGWVAVVAPALPVAGLVGWEALAGATPAEADVVAALWGLAALGGVLGPLGIQLALQVASQRSTWARGLEAGAVVDPERVVPPHRRRAGMPWCSGEVLPEGGVRDQALELEGDLKGLLRDVRIGPLSALREDARAYLDALRKETRRLHRRVHRILGGDDAEGRPDAIRNATVELVDRWRDHVLDRAARMRRRPWEPAELVEALDRIALQSPEAVAAPMPPPAEGDTLAVVVRELTGWVRGRDEERSVPIRAVFRYHLSGLTPARLEAVAAALVNTEFDLAARTRELFLRVVDTYAALADVPAEDLDEALLARVAEDLGGDFRSARDEVDEAVDALLGRLRGALWHAHADIVADLGLVGTPELPARARQLSRVATVRAEGMATLAAGLRRAREGAHTRWAALSLEVELMGLELHVQEALAEHGSYLARLVRGRGDTQLERVDDALDEVLGQLATELAVPAPGPEVAQRIRSHAEAFSRICTDVVRTADDLREQLAAHEVVGPLLEALVRAGQRLTEHYEVPEGPDHRSHWTLSPGVGAREVAFREVVLHYIETSVTRDLLALTHRYALKMDRMVGVVEDLDRVVAFNVELAAAELAVAGEVPVGADVLGQVHTVLVDAMERQRDALAALRVESAGWFENIETRVRAAVLDDLEALRVRVADGRFAEIDRERRTQRATEAAASLARASGMAGSHALRRWLGPDRLTTLAHTLGLPRTPDRDAPSGAFGVAVDDGRRGWRPRSRGVDGQGTAWLSPVGADEACQASAFAPPKARSTVPLVYRRLFSDQALVAGELLGHRAALADRVRRALEAADDTGPRILRTVAVVGPAGAGQRAVAQAALRGFKHRGVHHHDLSGPVGVAEVQGWFDRGAHGHVHVIHGFEHLLELRPEGFAPLKALVDGVVDDGGRNAWLVDADALTWRLARDVVPLELAFPVVVATLPLDAEELEAAMRARHAMSGFDLVFTTDTPDSPTTESLHRSERERVEARWFAAFHRATGGVARDALRLWLAAVDEVDVDGGTVRMGPVPEVPSEAMAALADEPLLLLVATARQGWIDARSAGWLFGWDRSEAQARLASLAWRGLLEPIPDGPPGRRRVPDHLRRSLYGRLEDQGWL